MLFLGFDAMLVFPIAQILIVFLGLTLDRLLKSPWTGLTKLYSCFPFPCNCIHAQACTPSHMHTCTCSPESLAPDGCVVLQGQHKGPTLLRLLED